MDRTSQPTHGVRISRGTVTHWNGEPITSYEQACVALDAIERLTGESGEITRVIASIQLGEGE